MLCSMLVIATNTLLYVLKYRKIIRVVSICVPVHSQKDVHA